MRECTLFGVQSYDTAVRLKFSCSVPKKTTRVQTQDRLPHRLSAGWSVACGALTLETCLEGEISSEVHIRCFVPRHARDGYNSEARQLTKTPFSRARAPSLSLSSVG